MMSSSIKLEESVETICFGCGNIISYSTSDPPLELRDGSGLKEQLCLLCMFHVENGTLSLQGARPKIRAKESNNQASYNFQMPDIKPDVLALNATMQLNESSPRNVLERYIDVPSNVHCAEQQQIKEEICEEDLQNVEESVKNFNSSQLFMRYSEDNFKNDLNSQTSNTVNILKEEWVFCVDCKDAHICKREDPKENAVQKNYKCSKCGLRFRSTYFLNIHKRRPEKRECEDCDDLHFCESQQSLHASSKPYKCQECGKTFSTKYYFNKHRRLHNKERLLAETCEECKSSNSCSKHQAFVFVKPYKCPICVQTFVRKYLLYVHMVKHGSNRECKECYKTFVCKKHKRLHDIRKPHKCVVCGKSFATKSNLLIHKAKQHGVKKTCGRCDEFYTCKRHRLVGTNGFSCKKCPMSFSSISALKRHISSHRKGKIHEEDQSIDRAQFYSGYKPFECLDCGKCFGSRYYMNVHKRQRHSNGLSNVEESKPEKADNVEEIDAKRKPFECADCNKAFASKYYYQVHSRYHSGERRFICEICGSAFVLNQYLVRHLKTHEIESLEDAVLDSLQGTSNNSASITRDPVDLNSKTTPSKKRYKCKDCEKDFASENNLHTHARLHIKRLVYRRDALYKCDICQKTFVTEYNLHVHTRTHTNTDKPYKCKKCDEAFMLYDYLIGHMKIHARYNVKKEKLLSNKTTQSPDQLNTPKPNEKKRFTCDVCGKNVNDIKRHFRIHSGEKPFKCTVCEKGFNLKESLKYHLKTHFAKDLGQPAEESPKSKDKYTVISSHTSGLKLSIKVEPADEEEQEFKVKTEPEDEPNYEVVCIIKSEPEDDDC